MPDLYIITKAIYRLQSNSYLITFKDADPDGARDMPNWASTTERLECKKVYRMTDSILFQSLLEGSPSFAL